jgi:hypothetical protein
MLENKTFNELRKLYNVAFHALKAVSVEGIPVLLNQGYSFVITSKQIHCRQSVNKSSVKSLNEKCSLNEKYKERWKTSEREENCWRKKR